MNRVERIYLDTNVFIALFESGQTTELLQELVDICQKNAADHRCLVTSELTYSELIVKPQRIGDALAVSGYDELIRTSKWLEVSPVDREILYYSALMRANFSHLKLPDAIHVATAVMSRCTSFLTADLGIKDRYEVLDGAEMIVLKVLRPDEPTLTSLIKSLSP